VFFRQFWASHFKYVEIAWNRSRRLAMAVLKTENGQLRQQGSLVRTREISALSHIISYHHRSAGRWWQFWCVMCVCVFFYAQAPAAGALATSAT